MLKAIENPDSSKWRRELKQAIRSPRELGTVLGLPEQMVIDAEEAVRTGFPFLVPWSFVEKIGRNDPQDPLLKQVWPSADETNTQPYAVDGYHIDPVGDSQSLVANGLLHKYSGRVLMVTTGACAVHCRYCFRQNFPYSDVPHNVDQWSPAIDYINSDESIHEVILSGGDPLTIRDSVLAELVQRLEAIEHIKRLRIHTRLPIVIPSRVNDEFCNWFEATRLSKWFVIHCNHANEIDDDVCRAIERLQHCRCNVLNQCVLLRGVNDNVQAQKELCEKLVDIGVTPYYIHHLDKVIGAERFEVAESTGLQIVDELRKILPGYALPKYVREESGEASKTLIR